MNCNTCGTLNVEGAKHCVGCGTALINELREQHESIQEVATAAEIQGQSGIPFQAQQETNVNYSETNTAESTANTEMNQAAAIPSQTNAFVDSTKNYVNSYFQYAGELLKKPYHNAFKSDRTTIYYGIANIIAFALFFGLATWVIFGKYAEVSFFGKGSSLSLFSVFIKPFIFAALVVGLGGVITYGLLKLQKKTEHILDVLSKWFAYMILPAALMPIVFLCTVVTLFKLAIVLFVLALLFILGSTASIVKQYQLGEEGALDYTYVVTIFLAINGLLMYLLINNIVGTIVAYIQDYFGSYFNGLF